MISGVIVIVCTGALVLATITTLASKAETRARLAGGATLIAAVGGLITYGYAYAVASRYPPLSVLQAAMAVLGMFLGRNEFAFVVQTPFFSAPGAQMLFWILHFFAMYATASAIFTALGTSVLHQIRLFLMRMNHITVIYGVTPETIPLGLSFTGRKNTIVFVDEDISTSDYQMILSEGGLVCSDVHALSVSEKFLKRTGIRRSGRKIRLYALHPDHAKSLDYARIFLAALQKAEIRPEKTQLVLLGYEDILGESFLNSENRYGYGNVSVFDEATLAARLLIRRYPPCNCLAFDENGNAKEDFDVLLIGFGKIGQAVLDELIMHGQFTGSRFHAAVFDPKYQQISGYIQHEQRGILNHYAIDFYGEDARSSILFDYLQAHRDTLKYIAVCLRNESSNTRLSQEINRYLVRLSCGASLFQCTEGNVRRISRDSRSRKKYSIYSPEVINNEKLDRMAMIVNQTYHRDSGRTKEENWKNCDYFSRMSCRAFADFVPAVLRAAGITAEMAVRPEDCPWTENSVLLENLARTEHLRWCAFHYVMGYESMDKDTVHKRILRFREEQELTGSGTINITKDTGARRHACLISWEELDELSRVVSEATGNPRDYRQMDVDNILSIPELLQQESAYI